MRRPKKDDVICEQSLIESEFLCTFIFLGKVFKLIFKISSQYPVHAKGVLASRLPNTLSMILLPLRILHIFQKDFCLSQCMNCPDASFHYAYVFQYPKICNWDYIFVFSCLVWAQIKFMKQYTIQLIDLIFFKLSTLRNFRKYQKIKIVIYTPFHCQAQLG